MWSSRKGMVNFMTRLGRTSARSIAPVEIGLQICNPFLSCWWLEPKWDLCSDWGKRITQTSEKRWKIIKPAIHFEVLTEDIMGSAQHDDVGVVVAQVQKPVGNQIPSFLLHLSRSRRDDIIWIPYSRNLISTIHYYHVYDKWLLVLSIRHTHLRV